MRILVDQSGYDLLNIGDVAMLQSCVTRLRMQWPAAEIMVIAAAPGRLADDVEGVEHRRHQQATGAARRRREARRERPGLDAEPARRVLEPPLRDAGHGGGVGGRERGAELLAQPPRRLERAGRDRHGLIGQAGGQEPP